MRLGRKGKPSLCSKMSPELMAKRPPVTQRWPSSSGPQGGWWPLWHRGAGEGISNLGVGSERVLMVCSTGLKNRMINESNATEEPESK